MFDVPTEKNYDLNCDNSSVIGFSPNSPSFQVIFDGIKNAAIHSKPSTCISVFLPKFRPLLISENKTEFDVEQVGCLGALSTLNPEHSLSLLSGLDTSATHWIFTHDEYKNWLKQTAPSVLFLHGKPGSGRSVIASAVVREMQAATTYQKKAVIFFFCNQQDERSHTTKELLSSLVRQLLLQQPSFFRYVQSTYPFTSGRSNWTREELWVIFRGILCSRDQIEIICIINGLDECEPSYMELWDEFGKAIVQTNFAEAPLKFLITGQRYLGTLASEKQCFDIDLDVEKGARHLVSDLVSTEVGELVKSRPGFQGFEQKIRDIFFQSQGSTIFSTRIALSEIATLKVHSTPFAIQKMLDSLSFSLPAVYQRYLANIPSDWQSWALKVLSWVLYTVRPFSTGELATVLAIEGETKSLAEIDNHIAKDIIGDLKQTLDLFISIENDKILLPSWNTRKFLTSQAELCNIALDPPEVHAHITQTCLVYLSAQEFSDISCLVDTDGNVIIPQSQWDLITYAVQYWPIHYRKAGTAVCELRQRVLDFLTKQMKSRVWSQLYWLLLRPKANMTWKSVEEIASELGLTEIVMDILDSASYDAERVTPLVEAAAKNGHDILVKHILEATSGSGGTVKTIGALCQAAERGHDSVIKLLLQFGCDPNQRIGRNSPLALAAKNGYVAAVRVLLDCGINDIPECSKSAALHLSAEHGHDLVVMALVDGEVNVNTVYELEGRSQSYPPLHLAVKGGHVAVVRKLIESGADVEPECPKLKPLHWAALNGHQNVAQQLIEAGAKVDISDGTGYTALHHAAENGYGRVVQLLLDSGAARDVLEPNNKTPLYLSAYEGHSRVVQLLLREEADVEANDSLGWTPLHAASANGHQDVVQQLIEAGANTDPTNRSKETPLHLAIANRHGRVVELLLDAGAEVDAEKYDGWTPLHLGAVNGPLNSVELLLEFGANVKARNNRGSTALVLASQEGNREIVELLLNSGSDAQHAINNKSTSLHRAAQRGHLEVVKLLLEAGASPVAKKASDGMTAIDLAQANGHEEVLVFLNQYQAEYPLRVAKEAQTPERLQDCLDGGVDVNIRDSEGCTMLFFTCGFGYEEATKILLEAGADPEVKDNYGRSPLDLAVENSIRILVLQQIQLRANKDSEPNLTIDTHDGEVGCSREPLSVWGYCDWCNNTIRISNKTVFFYRMNTRNTEIT